MNADLMRALAHALNLAADSFDDEHAYRRSEARRRVEVA